MTALNLASVAVGRPVHGEFTYRVPDTLVGRLTPGQRVLVPFGRGLALAFYLGPTDRAPEAKVQLKEIERELEREPALPRDLISLLRFAASHYHYPLGEAIRSALPPGLSQATDHQEIQPEIETFVEALPIAQSAQLARAPAQAAALSYLLAVGGRAPLAELSHAIPGAAASVQRLEQKGLVQLKTEEIRAGSSHEWSQARPQTLTPSQEAAVARIVSAIDGQTFRPFLLHGVTGSGKTEVYLRAVEHALAQGRGSLVLVPEIALTPQLVGRFRSRFGQGVAVLHSGLKDRDRLRHWQSLRAGEVRIAVGVRSAVFAPVVNLGLLAVDEEHDPSFKQEEKLRYNARDLALVRGQQAGATVILGSATPSLESLENANRGRYEKLKLSGRIDDRPLPTVSVVDLRIERPRTAGAVEESPILSTPLLSAMEHVLRRGQQVILFLNRRGHSTFLICEVCGTALRCENCDVCLTNHLSIFKVMCHYCGFTGPIPEHCKDCGGPLLRLGVGTERVAEEVASKFPRSSVARLDRDAITSANKLTQTLSSFARREIDVLVGTQMVAKGHDFPGVTLVCVVLADTSLALPDFRAAERTFHLLTQVAGRAGRGPDPGRVLVQTYNPDSEVVRKVLAHDFDGFAQMELRWRRAMAYPPFTRLIALRIEGLHPEQTADVARELSQRMSRRLPEASRGVRLLGPAPAPIRRIRGKTRWQLLLKGPTHSALEGPVAAAEAYLPLVPASVKVAIDVDPGAML